MLKTVQEYRRIKESLPAKIKKSAFKPKAFIKMLGMPSATFYNRMSDKNFSVQDTEKIVNILELEKKIEATIAEAEEQIANGKVRASDEVFSMIENKLQ